MKNIVKVALAVLVIAVVVAAGAFYSMNQMGESKEGFGVYLVENNELVLSDEEIVWYDVVSYEFKLTDEGANRITELDVPVTGSPFVLKVDGKEICEGSFWVSVSSLSYSGIVIDALAIHDNTISIDLGYPSAEFFEGTDYRNDPRIIDHFDSLGKLKQTFQMQIDYNPSNEENPLIEFQDDCLYMRGSTMHIVGSFNQQNFQLRKGDSVVLALVEYPSTVTQGFLSYNFVFLHGGDGLGDVACKEILLDEPLMFTVSEDGYYVFELGVINVDCYWFKDSVGVWTFDVTVVPA